MNSIKGDMRVLLGAIQENAEVFNEMTNAIVMVDCKGVVRFINDRALELLDAGKSYAVGSLMSELYTDTQLMETVKTLRVDHHVRLRIGTRNCYASRFPVYAQGNPVGAVALFDDVTKLEQLNSKIEADRSEMSILKTILELAYDGIVVVDTEGYITMISEAYKKFLNIEAHDVIGKHITEVIANTRMHVVARTGIPEINDFQEINGDYMVATRMPYYVDGVLAGAIGKVIFRNMSELQNINKKYLRVERELKNLRSEISSFHRPKYALEQIITSDPKILKLKQYARRISQSKSNVLIQGESGTGKELFAHALHVESNRSEMPFIKVNCAAIPDNLLESELFGYEKGAFTGADKNGRIGKFELADQGTIFLDEIGDMPLHMQAKILRVLQEGEVERIGSNAPKNIDIRVIAATNRPLLKMVEEKLFREDLYYRLNVINLSIPPLRERKEDILPLARHFIDRLNRENHGKVKGISEKAQLQLAAYAWPGNIRELKNVVERAYNIIEGEEVIKTWHLSAHITSGFEHSVGEPLRALVEQAEKKVILERLIAFKGNKTKTAEDLGISRMTFHKKLNQYGIK